MLLLASSWFMPRYATSAAITLGLRVHDADFRSVDCCLYPSLCSGRLSGPTIRQCSFRALARGRRTDPDPMDGKCLRSPTLQPSTLTVQSHDSVGRRRDCQAARKRSTRPACAVQRRRWARLPDPPVNRTPRGETGRARPHTGLSPRRFCPAGARPREAALRRTWPVLGR